MRFQGKTVLVTGGNSGIGLAVAARIVKEGGKVVITGRDEKTIKAAVAKLGPAAVGRVVNVRSLKALDELFEIVKKDIGKLDGLVANAGVAIFGPVQSVSEEDFDALVDTNIKGTFFTLQKSLDHLKDGASIVITGSVAGMKGRPVASVYALTKAADRSMARTFASSLLERRIRVNVVVPGPIETPIWDRTGGIPAEKVAKTKEDIASTNPMKRYGTPEEVAAAAAFLLSDEASYTTGAELVVDGGFTQL